MNPYCTLTKKESRDQYQLRVFVNIANSWYLKQISAAAYDYYYQQVNFCLWCEYKLYACLSLSV